MGIEQIEDQIAMGSDGSRWQEGDAVYSRRPVRGGRCGWESDFVRQTEPVTINTSRSFAAIGCSYNCDARTPINLYVEIEITHEGLHAYRKVRGVTKEEVETKARLQLDAWNARWKLISGYGRGATGACPKTIPMEATVRDR